MTDQLKFVEDLKRRWLAIIDSMVDPLMEIDPKTMMIVKANKSLSDLASFKNVREVIGLKCYKVFADLSEPCKGCPLVKKKEFTSSERFELRGIRTRFDFEVTSKPIISEDGRLQHLVHVYRDQTLTNQLHRQLLQNEKMASIGLLAGGIAHEINNPLAGILLFSQMLLKEMPKEESSYADVLEIEKAAQRCKSIVERLLRFAHMDQNEGPLVKINVVETIKEALHFAMVHEYARKIEVHENFLTKLVSVLADQNSLIQVFLNLIQNAFHAMKDEGGHLWINETIEEKNGRHFDVWEIKDSGKGIKKEDLKKIFEPFFTTKDPGEGTGLGLSICYSICQSFGGFIDVSSKENMGSSFKVYLPIAA